MLRSPSVRNVLARKRHLYRSAYRRATPAVAVQGRIIIVHGWPSPPPSPARRGRKSILSHLLVFLFLILLRLLLFLLFGSLFLLAISLNLTGLVPTATFTTPTTTSRPMARAPVTHGTSQGGLLAEYVDHLHAENQVLVRRNRSRPACTVTCTINEMPCVGY